MSTPILKLVFDRKKIASPTKEGSVELRITYNRVQRFATTGVRLLPKHWRNGSVVNRIDALDIQHTLDLFVVNARKIVNEQLDNGTLDMRTIVSLINVKPQQQQNKLLPYFHQRATVRKYGRSDDSQKRYDRFIRWFERWGGMTTFSDISDINIMLMDQALGNMKDCSKWNNYHRFLNSFILDAIEEGLLTKNPYKTLHINKDKIGNSIDKYLTQDEFNTIAHLQLPTSYLRHAQDLFIFQTYTCLAYVDLMAFNADAIRLVNGHHYYTSRRGKTNQGYSFILLQPALDILNKYNGHLPVISNQKYNNYLKMIAVMAGINKPVSSHWARHTGATILLNNGVTIEVVSHILGHSSTNMTRQVYAKLLDDTIITAMDNVDKKLSRHYRVPALTTNN